MGGRNPLETWYKVEGSEQGEAAEDGGAEDTTGIQDALSKVAPSARGGPAWQSTDPGLLAR